MCPYRDRVGAAGRGRSLTRAVLTASVTRRAYCPAGMTVNSVFSPMSSA